MSWIGYCATTGIPAVDYAVMDAIHVPRGRDRWFTEQVIRLPAGHWCYTAPDYAPPVADPPAIARGYITFGSFNNPIKLNDDVLAIWAETLATVPDSRLLLIWPSYGDATQRNRILAELRFCSVDPDRVEFRPGLKHRDLLAAYGDVDVALDPFPFSGGITSCELLWMGVPVVTWPQSRPVSRQTMAHLRAIGRNEWIAQDAEDYIRICAGVAADVPRLQAMRRSQRDIMKASSLCDADRFARDFQTALRRAWQDWCARQ